MKTTTTFSTALLVLSLSLSACAVKVEDVPGYSCEVALGAYKLHYPGISVQPYENKTTAIFTDSLGNVDTFAISFRSKRSAKSIRDIYTDKDQKNALTHCFTTQYYKFFLDSKKSKVQFTLTVAAMPEGLAEWRVCNDAASKASVDVLDIFGEDKSQKPIRGYLLFCKRIDTQTTAPTYGVKQSFPEIEFFNRKFRQVETLDFSTDPASYSRNPSKLYYNTTEGIVAFSLKNNTLWRLAALY